MIDKPRPYTMEVPDKMIKELRGQPGNALEKKPTIAITNCSLHIYVCFLLRVNKAAVHVHLFPSVCTSQIVGRQMSEFLHEAKKSTSTG